MEAANSPAQCPCGSGADYSRCCQPWLLGQPAPTPEALMRSRYTAFVKHNVEYLLATWHSATRPSELELEGSPAWTSLNIIEASEKSDRGTVHFRALYRTGSGWGYLEEQSDFVREEGRWFYLSGTTSEGQLKPGRNDVCPCGSGRKFKVCCLRK
ncbi:YchJ family metal-binding protein [Marinobacter sp. S0848L]|uniref:YchJ family protein n=1 Tax=Marinobacter sp. S0848L TaxID=2926423 RepID=UPI001FF1E965|nr:YchJ family metal-binding protein [Marinobacter sp. S0848L]MCK0106543.1 SEC-C domain-containing protein [Marinobacter sp. S0848L]